MAEDTHVRQHPISEHQEVSEYLERARPGGSAG